MSTATLASPAVTAFAAAVRDALSDLPADEIDELTDGLEADLTERIADGGVDDPELGDPLAYAEELRTAAGLPRRTTSRAGSSVLSELRAVPAQVIGGVRALAVRYPALDALGRFLATLRPVWWVFRAAAVTWLGFSLFGSSGWAPLGGSTIVVFLVLTVVSVQFGRSRWLPFAWMKGLLLAANIVLAIAAPFVLAGAAASVNNSWYSSNYAESFPDQSSSGLTLDGSEVSNVFAYDAQGNPLSDVQLFDQDGKPLDLVGDPTMPSGFFGSDSNPLVPNDGVAGRLGWNVYPLAHVGPEDLTESGAVKRSVTPIPATAPFATAKPLAESTGVPTPSPVPSGAVTAAPSATPTPTPAPAP
jgi:hypothetical protein